MTRIVLIYGFLYKVRGQLLAPALFNYYRDLYRLREAGLIYKGKFTIILPDL